MMELAGGQTPGYDVVLLGTSPLMLSRAADYAHAGARVMLVDRCAYPGGSWTAQRVLGFDNVEIGVHLIENRPEVYDYLTAASGVEMVADCESRNAGRLWGIPVPFALSRVCLHSLAAAKAVMRGRPESAALMARSAVRSATRLGAPFAYPVKGCGRLVAGMVERVEASGGRLLLGTEVTALTLDAEAGTVTLDLSGGHRLRARRAVISSRANAPVRSPDMPALHVDTTVIMNVVLHFAGTWVRPTGYVELIGDPSLKRVRDVGAFAVPALPEGEGLATIQLRGRDPEAARADAADVLSHLMRLRLVAQGARAIGIEWHIAYIATARAADLEHLSQAFGDLLEIIPSTDLAEELFNRLRSRNCTPSAFARQRVFDD